MKRFFFFVLLVPLFLAPCSAEELYGEGAESFGTDRMEAALDREAREISGKFIPDGSYDTQGALKRLWDSLLDKLQSSLRKELGTATALVGIAFLCALCSALCSDKASVELVSMAGCAAVVYISMGGAQSVMDEAMSALTELSDYSKAALPAVFTASAVSGAALSAAGRYAAVCLALNVMMSTAQTVMIPLTCAYLAISAASSVLGNALLRTAAGFAKHLAVLVLTVLTIAFCAYIGISGIVSGTADAAAVKTAKTVISSALPVVGGIISDASAAVLSAAGVIRASAGAFSLIAVCALCITPFARLGVKLIVFRLASAVAETLPNGRMSVLLDDIGTAMGILTGTVGSFAVILFFSFTSAIRAVV